MSHILEVSDLEVSFSGDGGKNISVDHISFYVDPGEVVCIVGESGCGKASRPCPSWAFLAGEVP